MTAYSHLPLALADRAPADGVSPAAIHQVASLLGALAHPKRLALVAALARQELCVCELVDLLGLPQPLVSHHLGALRAAGIVRDRRDAHWVYYSLVPEALTHVRHGLAAVLGAGPLPPSAAPGANPGCAPPGR